MAAEAKALLDELMGRSRNLDPADNPEDLSWDSADVCKYFLCAFCPHELFTNTRADLVHEHLNLPELVKYRRCRPKPTLMASKWGSSPRVIRPLTRARYQNSPRFEKCGYEEDFIRFLQTLITDVEKRIRRGHQRLALNSQQGALNGTVGNQNEEKVTLLTERINELVVQKTIINSDCCGYQYRNATLANVSLSLCATTYGSTIKQKWLIKGHTNGS
ncbi:luc7-like protein 3 [Aplysia californica]|uniref:Luc7-like protein 3 n=1 Tax=Aplysia californica TaxID=6500 RepID=A0ABM0ZZN8_APLCA|nr:luc7-like protein 3 [Aplysia californica]